MKARFTACATGWPEPEVEWFLNGERIYPNERTQVEAEPNGKYIEIHFFFTEFEFEFEIHRTYFFHRSFTFDNQQLYASRCWQILMSNFQSAW